MSKHTPGPWYAVEYAGHINIQTTDDYSIEEDVLEADNVGLELMHANGKLAAAAPDMYELLLDMNMEGGHGLKIHERIRNIISKISK